jgi:tetratricopeptide (TPR) repeat protein
MKKILILLAIIITQFTIEAQIKTPQASPKATIDQVVGLTDVEIVYSRPLARGRAVFGNLVPFGELWRTGANENTIISFSDDVIIDGKTLKKGKYALYTIPNIQSWEVIFYTTTDNWGTPKEFNEANVALRTIVKEDATPKAVDTFTIGISDVDTNSAHLEISWENSHVALKFEVPTQKNAMASIEKVLAGPAAADYFAAAQYYYQSNGDNNKARTFIDKSLEMSAEKPFYVLRQKSLIQAKQGDKKGAIETAKLSIIAAEAAGNKDYVKMNKDSISEWSK